MNQDSWNPAQYNRFKQQRAQPFWDLLGLVQDAGDFQRIIDLGCGTGELTRALHERFPAAETLGIDSSEAMLNETWNVAKENLRFEKKDIQEFHTTKPFDLVFSNATLQWIPHHEYLFPRISDWVRPGGQIAIQMPFNFDHPSHRIAREVAEEFLPLKGQAQLNRILFPQERYSELLYQSGFHDQKCRLEIYLHPMESGNDVIEWTKGTLLTSYKSLLSHSDFEAFISLYRDKLLREIGEGSYVYAFKRLLLWGRKNNF